MDQKFLQDAITLLVVINPIGTTGATVMSRVLGLVLAALAMQTMLDGLKPYLMSLR